MSPKINPATGVAYGFALSLDRLKISPHLFSLGAKVPAHDSVFKNLTRPTITNMLFKPTPGSDEVIIRNAAVAVVCRAQKRQKRPYIDFSHPG